VGPIIQWLQVSLIYGGNACHMGKCMGVSMHLGCDGGFKSHVLKDGWCCMTGIQKGKTTPIGLTSGILVFSSFLSAHSHTYTHPLSATWSQRNSPPGHQGIRDNLDTPTRHFLSPSKTSHLYKGAHWDSGHHIKLSYT
jgi:hypothetical protein